MIPIVIAAINTIAIAWWWISELNHGDPFLTTLLAFVLLFSNVVLWFAITEVALSFPARHVVVSEERVELAVLGGDEDGRRTYLGAGGSGPRYTYRVEDEDGGLVLRSVPAKDATVYEGAGKPHAIVQTLRPKSRLWILFTTGTHTEFYVPSGSVELGRQNELIAAW